MSGHLTQVESQGVESGAAHFKQRAGEPVASLVGRRHHRPPGLPARIVGEPRCENHIGLMRYIDSPS